MKAIIPGTLVVLLVGITACTVVSDSPSSAPRPSSTSQPTGTTDAGIVTTSTSVSPNTSTVPVTTTTTSPVLAGKTVVLDPGHNGMNWAHPDEINELVDIGNGEKACNTTGTMTSDGYTEAEFTWTVASLTKTLLEQRGARVVLTRDDNEGWGPCIDERAAVGNNSHADAVISIHADGGPDDGRGFHVIHPAMTPGLTDDIYEGSLRLARSLHQSYGSTSMPVSDYIGEGGYSERDDLGGLNLSDVPAVFLEAGNMRNDEDIALLTDAEFQIAIARAIVSALVEFLAG